MPEWFSLRCRNREKFVHVAIRPEVVSETLNTSTLSTQGTATAWLSLVVVAETTLDNGSFRSEVLYLQPCPRSFLVPRVMATSPSRIIKLLWENVTCVGLNKRREVSCLITVSERDVCLSQLSETGDMLQVCREEFKFEVIDCVFQAVEQRIIYVSRQRIGIIEFDFEVSIERVQHTVSVIQDSPTHGEICLTCACLVDTRDEVLLGDNKGRLFVYRISRGTITRRLQLTFPFPLASLTVASEQGPLVFLAGTAPTPTTKDTKNSKEEQTIANLMDLSGYEEMEHHRDHDDNAVIIRTDRRRFVPPVYQGVGGGYVSSLAWYRHPTHPLLTTIDSKHMLLHYRVNSRVDMKPVEAFAMKPLPGRGGKAVWGGGGWLALITEGEAVLVMEEGILYSPPDSP